MFKAMRLLSLIIFLPLIITGCVSTSVAENAPPPTLPAQKAVETILPNTNGTPTLAANPLVPCKEENLQQARETISTVFKDGRLEQIRLTQNHHGGAFVISPDGLKMAIQMWHYGEGIGQGSIPDSVYIFSITDGQLLCILPIQHNGENLEGISFSPDASLLASIYYDGTVLLRNSITGEILRELKTIEYQSPGSVVFNNAGSFLVTSGYFQPARVWNVKTGRLVMSIDASRVAISPNGELLAVVEKDSIKVVDILSQEEKIDINDTQNKAYLLFSNDGNFLYLLNNYSEITVFDIRNGEIVQKLNTCSDCSGWGWEVETRLTLSSDGLHLLMENPSRVIMWDTSTWREIINGRNSDVDEYLPIVDAMISPHGNMVIVNYSDVFIQFWYLNQ